MKRVNNLLIVDNFTIDFVYKKDKK